MGNEKEIPRLWGKLERSCWRSESGVLERNWVGLSNYNTQGMHFYEFMVISGRDLGVINGNCCSGFTLLL
jgi:hypothetical protein